MRDRLRMGKPPPCKTRHPGLLSLSRRSVGRQSKCPAKAGEVNRHILWYTSPYSWSCSNDWCLVDGQGSSRTGTPFPFYFIQRPLFFFCILQLLTVIFHGSPSVIKLIRLFPAFMHVNNNDVTYTANSWRVAAMYKSEVRRYGTEDRYLRISVNFYGYG